MANRNVTSRYLVLWSLLCYDISTDVQHLLNVEGEPSKVSCPSGSADAILALVNAGADVNAADKDGLTGELMHSILLLEIKVDTGLYLTPALA